ncbi:class I SAM-dependent methyltransferase [Pseudovibrio sp. JE062]|uniref:class I SAM-dependent DNA methyltransferase n=1 Tax=Pseudovibrio sp. JE062 TaxID=439495 RepID=UPI000186C1ED|nr:methyltransferase domain-containing protein [Pseudovibrio sp. JE062]EEA93939.1 3-demethylubiquinone-9 3-methyltransferase [Pseudovibrio sp. JE062]
MDNDKNEEQTNPLEDILRHFKLYDQALDLKGSKEFNAAADHLLKRLEQDSGEVSEQEQELSLYDTQAATSESLPADYVSALFDQKAELFDLKLMEILKYSVPHKIHQSLQSNNLGPFKRLLDLGCGTGLAAEALQEQVSYKTGVDISKEMLKLAQDKHIYDEYHLSEINAFLYQNHAYKWDMVVAAELFPYFGALEEVFEGITRNIEQDGIFIFSAEAQLDQKEEAPEFRMSDTHRFSHTEHYLRNVLKQFGFTPVEFSQINLRNEQETPVPGYFVIARYKPT